MKRKSPIGRHLRRIYASPTNLSNKSDKSHRRAFDVALDYLALRDRSEKEIVEYLKKRKKYPDAEAEEALGKLKEYGYINDEKFARGLAVSLFSSGRSSSVVRRELLKKGIDSALISEIITQVKPSFEDEVKIAYETIVRKYRLTSALDDKNKNRVISFLARRGYEWDVIRKVLSRLGREISDE